MSDVEELKALAAQYAASGETEKEIEVYELLELASQQASQADQSQRPSEGVFASEQDKQAHIESLPELRGLLSGEDGFKTGAISPALLTATDPYEMGQILTANFPHVGVVQTPEGEFIAVNNKTGAKSSLNKPGLSPVDVIQGLGLMAAFWPAGSVAQIPAQIGQRVATGAGTALATQSLIEGGQAAAGGEVSPSEIGIATAFGGAGELVAPAVMGAKNLFKSADEVLPERQIAQEAVDALQQATGKKVGLLPAQSAGDADLLINQRFIAQQPETSKMAAEALKKQNKDVYDATSALIDTLGSEGALETGVSRLYNASNEALSSAKRKVNNATRPMYAKAFEINPDITIAKENTLKHIDEALDSYADGKIKSGLLSVRNSIDSAKNLKQLQGAKFGIDEILEPPKGAQNAVGSVTRREVQGIKDKLMAEMTEISPEFRAANDKYARLMKENVEPLQSSAVGKIASMTDSQLSNLTNKLFDAREVNPAAVKNAKRIITDVDPDAWNEILRVEAQKRIGGLIELIGETTDDVANRPGQIKQALFGNPEKRRVFLAAMNPTQRSNFLALETVLTRASAGRAQGSPTALYQQVEERLKGGSVRKLKAIKSPISSALGATEQSIFNKNLKAMATAMFDPDYAGDFAKASMAKTPTSIKAFSQMLDNIAEGIEDPEERQVEEGVE